MKALASSAWPTEPTTSPIELSGGQQQRVAIARALVNRPAPCCWPTNRPATSTAARSIEIMVNCSRSSTDSGITIVHGHPRTGYSPLRAERNVQCVDGMAMQDQAVE